MFSNASEVGYGTIMNGSYGRGTTVMTLGNAEHCSSRTFEVPIDSSPVINCGGFYSKERANWRIILHYIPDVDSCLSTLIENRHIVIHHGTNEEPCR